MSTAIEQLREVNPAAVKLAEAVAFAVMIDRALLRTARLELVPEADAGAEADLWFSALVQSRTADGIVLDPAIAEELRHAMKLNPERVEQVWSVTEREHASLAPSLRIEEEIAYLSFSAKPTASEQLARKLRSVLAAMVSGERSGIARWATRALAMFPSAVRDLPEAKMLDTGARMRLGEAIDVASSDAAMPSWLPWVAPASLGKVGLSFELRDEELEIRTDPSGKPPIEIPNTNPLVLEVSWKDADRTQRIKQVTFRRGEVVPPVTVGRGELRIRTITGEEYDLRELGTVPDRFRERIIDFSEEMERHPELIGREEEIERLRSRMNERYITVMGPLGIGKTAFLCHLVRTMSREMPVFVHFFRGGNYRLDRIAAAERSLVAQIALRFDLGEHVLDMRLGDVLDSLALRPNRPEKMMIVLDDADEAHDERRNVPDEPLRAIVPPYPPDFVTIVASARRGVSDTGWVLTLPPADDMTLSKFSGFFTSDPEAGGNFAKALLPREHVVEDYFLSLSSDERISMGMLAVQKEPRFDTALDPRVLLTKWRNRIVFINDLAREWVRQSRHIDLAECHRSIVRAVESSTDNRDYYVLCGPTHLVEAGDLDEARRRILDVAFMREKITRFGVNALLADLRQIVSASEPGTMPGLLLERIDLDRLVIEDAPDDLAPILYSLLLNEGMPAEQITAELRLPPLPLVPAAPVPNPQPRWARRHEERIVGSAIIDAPWRVATWSTDGTVKLWPRERREAYGRLALTGPVTAFDPSARVAIAGDANGFLHIFDLSYQTTEARIAAHDRAIDGILFGDEDTVTWAGSDPIRLWTMPRNGSIDRTGELAGHTDTIVGCVIAADGNLLVSVSRDATCRVWNLRELRQTGKYEMNSPFAAGIGVIGDHIATATDSRHVYIMGVREDGVFIDQRYTTGHELSISGLAVSRPYVVTWSEDQTLRLFDVTTGRAQVLAGHRAAVTACRITAEHLVSGAADGTAIVWNLATGTIVSRLEGHLGAIRTIAIDGDTVFTAGDDRALKEWDARTGREIADHSLPPERITGCAALPGGRTIVCDETSVRVGERRIEIVRPILASDSTGAFTLACAATGDLALRYGLDTDLPSLTRKHLTKETIASCAVEGIRIAFGTTAGTVTIDREWSQTEVDRRSNSPSEISGEPLWSRTGAHRGRVSALAFSDHGLVSASWDGTLAVWDYDSLIRRIEAHDSRILAMAVYARYVVTGASDGSIVAWNIETGEVMTRFDGHKAAVTACRMNSAFVVTASLDRTIQVHSLGYRFEKFCRGHLDTITDIALDEDVIYSCSEDRTIRRWDPRSGEQTGIVYGTAPFRCISASGSTIIAGDDAGNVWTLNAGATLHASAAATASSSAELATSAAELARKRAAGEFDVFLCHNSSDKRLVRDIAVRLEARGILPWLDERELPPGQPWQRVLEEQIANVKSVAIFVGATGVGPWQQQELYAFLRGLTARRTPMIPVLLSDAQTVPQLPLFLRQMSWVDFRVDDPDPIERLIWGITGKRPPTATGLSSPP